eukprot:scaffold217766_cov32-Tisochrysis_lutea.AAC.3
MHGHKYGGHLQPKVADHLANARINEGCLGADVRANKKKGVGLQSMVKMKAVDVDVKGHRSPSNATGPERGAKDCRVSPLQCPL